MTKIGKAAAKPEFMVIESVWDSDDGRGTLLVSRSFAGNCGGWADLKAAQADMIRKRHYEGAAAYRNGYESMIPHSFHGCRQRVYFVTAAEKQMLERGLDPLLGELFVEAA